MNDIAKIIELLPDTVKYNTIDLTDVRLKDGRVATRVTMDRLLTSEEKSQMQNKHFIGLDCLAVYRYAPEIKKSYFYVV